MTSETTLTTLTTETQNLRCHLSIGILSIQFFRCYLRMTILTKAFFFTFSVLLIDALRNLKNCFTIKVKYTPWLPGAKISVLRNEPKLAYFSNTYILPEISFIEFKIQKTTKYTVLGALSYDFCEF